MANWGAIGKLTLAGVVGLAASSLGASLLNTAVNELHYAQARSELYVYDVMIITGQTSSDDVRRYLRDKTNPLPSDQVESIVGRPLPTSNEERESRIIVDQMLQASELTAVQASSTYLGPDLALIGFGPALVVTTGFAITWRRRDE